MASFRYFRRTVLAGLLSGVTVVGVAAVAVPASASGGPQRHTIAGSTPRWLNKARSLGATPSSQQVNFGVLLSMRDQAGAAAALQAISEPTSASYGHWLSNQTFDETYGPAKASVTAVQDWLRSQGFQVTQTLPSGMYVEASGTVAQVQKTFGTQLRNYSYLGKTVRANATELSLPSGTPAGVSSAISGVLGIDQGSTLKTARRHACPGRRPVRGTEYSPARRTSARRSPPTSPRPTARTSRTSSAGTYPSSISRLTGRARCYAGV